jgi:hypothetical protein
MLAASAFAQDKPYSLKGFTVGESTLQDFKAQFRHCADNCSDNGRVCRIVCLVTVLTTAMTLATEMAMSCFL